MPKTAPLVVVVDDERDIADMVCEFLDGDGFKTASAYDGESGLETILSRKPDAVIMDVKMPGMDGTEVVRRLRADPDAALAKTPVIILTATRVVEDLQNKFRELGVFRWMDKPFDPDVLIQSVREAIQSRPK